MWFRPGQHGDSDRFRVSSIRNRIRRRKSTANAAKKQNIDGSSEDTVDNSGQPFSESLPLAKSKENEIAGVHVPMGGAIRSASGRRLSLHAALNQRAAIDANLKTEKEKVLLNDRKFKSNRVTKSSSKSKMADLIDKTQNSMKSTQLNSGSARKISVPTTHDVIATNPKPKSVRTNANLNLNALLRYKSFISGTTKKLTHEDFDRLRRKSLGENGKLNGRKLSGAEKKDIQKKCKFNKNNSNIDYSCNEYTDDEMFHSCNDDDDGNGAGGGGGGVDTESSSTNVRNTRHASPSLTSRVAARFTEGVKKEKSAAKQKCDRRKASCYCYPTTEGCYELFSFFFFFVNCFYPLLQAFFIQILFSALQCVSKCPYIHFIFS